MTVQRGVLGCGGQLVEPGVRSGDHREDDHPVEADVGQPADASWVVLADPEGNESRLLSRTVQAA